MPRVHHSHEDWATVHVTTRTVEKAFYLAPEREKRVIVQALDFYRKRGDFNLIAFVVMDSHVHFVIQVVPEKALSGIVGNFKRWTSRQNVAKPFGRDLWERRFDDNQISTDRELWEIVRYIHDNPVRAGMVSRPEYYLWSSVRNYMGMAPVALEFGIG